MADFNAATQQTMASPLFVLGVAGASNSQRMYRRYQSTGGIFGVPKAAIQGGSEYHAAVTGDPSKQFYWHVWVRNVDQATTIITQIMVEITYYCRFYEKKEQAEV